MKRSEINAIIYSADEFFRHHGFYLPPFAYWSPAVWASKGKEVGEIVECRLGWDITDFGKRDFKRFGLVLFTIRNGRAENLRTMTGKQYAEKIMIVEVGQKTSMHFHLSKMEDIINRGGGRLIIQLYNATPDEALDKARPVLLSVDGVSRRFKPGEVLELLGLAAPEGGSSPLPPCTQALCRLVRTGIRCRP